METQNKPAAEAPAPSSVEHLPTPEAKAPGVNDSNNVSRAELLQAALKSSPEEITADLSKPPETPAPAVEKKVEPKKEKAEAETPEPEPEVPAEVTPEPEPEAEPETEEPETPVVPEEPEIEAADRVRIGSWDNEVEKLAVTLKQKASANGQKLSLVEALQKAAVALGQADPTAKTEAPKVEDIPSVESFDAKIAELRKQKDEAKTAYDVDKVDSLNEEINKLSLEQVDAKQKLATRAQTQEQSVKAEEARYTATLKKSQETVLTDYSHLDAKDEKSPFRLAMIDEAEKYADDPVADSPNFPEFLATKVAKRPEFAKVPKVSKAVINPPAKPVVTPKKQVVSPAPVQKQTVTPAPVVLTRADLMKTLTSFADPADAQRALDRDLSKVAA